MLEPRRGPRGRGGECGVAAQGGETGGTGSRVRWTGQRRSLAPDLRRQDSRVQGAAVEGEGMDFDGVQNARKRRAEESTGEGAMTFTCLNFLKATTGCYV